MAEIGSAVAGKVVDSLYEVAKKEIGYMWNCKENVEKFRDEAEKLEVTRGRVQELMDIAIRKGDKISYGVEEWVNEANTEISKAEEFLKQEASSKKTCCKIGLCGNWGTLHRYGKSATKMAPSLLQLQERGSVYESCVSVETPAPGRLDVYQNKDLDDIHTHSSVLRDIMKSLEDDSIQITGIYGLGGVGKTTLAMEVVAKVKKNMLFAGVAFTTVSQNVDVEKIKSDIEEATKRVMKGDKILIILDDVWEKLNLEELCIPFGNNYMNCKILLTSRSEKVCQKMNAQSKICVNSLPMEEAWILFKRVVGERVETDSSLKLVALKVVEQCGGLPLLIQVVGNALKNDSIKSWNLALNQLRKHAPLDIDEEIRKSFTHLKLSYDYLKSEEAKSCFLLCSLFPEDHEISLEELVHYGVGLERFDELDSIEDARGRVQNAVNILTSSCLLLKVEDDEISRTKMHDVVRDVALLIASQGNNKFLVKAGQGLNEWLPRETGLKGYSGISLMYNDIIKLPHYEVHLSGLEIFLVNANRHLSMISDEFIGCMRKAKVLDISGNNISSLPQSFQLLTKLRTLNLRGNKCLHEISILGKVKDLEILILTQTGITEIPKEIAELENLRVLHVNDCEDLSRIRKGVLSSFSRLEELCIEFKLKFEGALDCIVEVMSLSKLTYLGLTVPSIDDIPVQGFNFEKLKGFVIQIGECYESYIDMSRSDRYLILSKLNLRVPLVKWLKNLIEGSRPSTYLYEIENLNNMMSTLYYEGFNKLEHIKLESCPNVSCLVDEGKTQKKFFKKLKHLRLSRLDNLVVIWKCPDEYISVTNLVKLKISGCEKLERVFTVTGAQGLVNIKMLYIEGCHVLEEVIYGGEDDEARNVIVFPSLTFIYLGASENLKSFFNSAVWNTSIKYPSLEQVIVFLCGNMEKWGSGIHEMPNLKGYLVNSDMQTLTVVDGPFDLNEVLEKSYTEYKALLAAQDKSD